MRINHNIAALNTYRQLTSASTGQAKSMEKLSSGQRINKAGDDAAGLAISEKMRGQIRGLDQASRNAQDGISLIQTAEGALNETHSILQRMRELATQSANDTNTSQDRKEIQKEMNQLTSEINRIGNTTEFNSQKLLDGTKIGGSAKITGSANVAATTDLSSIPLGVFVDFHVDGQLYEIDETALKANFGTGKTNSDVISAVENAELITNNSILLSTVADVSIDGGKLVVTSKSTGTSSNVTLDYWGANVAQAALLQTAFGMTDGLSNNGDDGITLQIGANQSQQFSVQINNMRSVALGVSGTTGGSSAIGVGTTAGDDVVGATFTLASAENELTENAGATEYALDISTSSKATAAIEVINQAIESVSSERSRLGANQNRLEHTINNLNTSSENLTAAESRIRDVDMAKEMMTQTKNSILSQAAQAMLAQANQQPQGVLQLLR
ncbi:flagellin [Bacillus timonensis]|nr:flagellin [Bacillus timonensis]